MKKIFTLLILTFLNPSKKVYSQRTLQDSSVINCWGEVELFCDTTSFFLKQNTKNALNKDLSAIRAILQTETFDKKSVRQMKKFAHNNVVRSYSGYKRNDTFFHYVDFYLLNIFKLKFICKTYKSTILTRGLSLEQAYSAYCSKNDTYISMFLPSLLQRLYSELSNHKIQIIGCGLLLLDNWDELQQEYEIHRRR
ncbi:MAG: hypothetical protein QM687_11785 [Ferruginibacter sp.]